MRVWIYDGPIFGPLGMRLSRIQLLHNGTPPLCVEGKTKPKALKQSGREMVLHPSLPPSVLVTGTPWYQR